jgi:hypothetical protein
MDGPSLLVFAAESCAGRLAAVFAIKNGASAAAATVRFLIPRNLSFRLLIISSKKNLPHAARKC